LIEGWRNRYHQAWVDGVSDRYFADLVGLSTTLPYMFFQFYYQYCKPMGSNNYAEQIGKYNLALAQLKTDPNMYAHVVYITKMVDDLQLNLDNSRFNADSNFTLTEIRAVDRRDYFRSGSIYYVYHIGFRPLD
jgi:hypothetical protein